MNFILVLIVITVVVAVTVLIHYQALFHITLWLQRSGISHRFRIVFGLVGALLAHVLEVCVFAVVYYLFIHQWGWGQLEGNFDGSFLNCAYYSFAVYTTVGFGDIYPIGDVRMLTGIEALTGLVLITWTASFLYLEMQNNWSKS